MFVESRPTAYSSLKMTLKYQSSNLKCLYRNLELIVGDDGVIYAYRSDHPYDMREMVKDDGKWKFTDEGKNLDEFNLERLKILCINYLSN